MDLYIEIIKKFPDFTLNVKFEGTNEKIGLLGASGAGKSMTLRCIAGLINPDEGKIIVNGKTYFDSNKNINIRPQKRKVGFLFQNYALFPHLNVKQNIAFGILGMSEHQKDNKVMQLLEKFHISGLHNRYPHQISSGQQQRVALARALSAEPDVLLLDEPFSALDEHLRAQMLKEMLELLKDFKTSTLFVTHNMEEAFRICDNLAVLSNGELQAFGNKNKIFENPLTSAAARITGFKNIAPANSLDDGFIEVPLWNIKLKTNNHINTRNGYIGIRASQIEFASTVSINNVFKAKIVDKIESPFSQTLYLKFENSNDSEIFHIQCEVAKEHWDKTWAEFDHLNIHLPEDKIMYFEK